MDPQTFRSRVLKNLLASPLVLIPAGLGLATFTLAILVGAPTGFLGFLGLSGILAGAGMAATRWILGWNELTSKTFNELQGESNRSQAKTLDELEQSLKADHDPRTTQSVRDLRQLYRRLERAGVMGDNIDSLVLPDIKNKAEQLYQSCLASLARTLELWQAAQEMATVDARKQVLMQRETLIGEVNKSVNHLGKTLDHLQTLLLKRDRQDESLARMREELEMGLQVSQRVELRIDQLDQLGRDAAASTGQERGTKEDAASA